MSDLTKLLEQAMEIGEIMGRLEPLMEDLRTKITLADEIISNVVEKLSKYPWLVDEHLVLDNKRIDLEWSYILDAMVLKYAGEHWSRLNPADKLHLVKLLPIVLQKIEATTGKLRT